MKWDQIAKHWRADFVNKLQDRYGLPEGEAQKKAETWLEWLKKKSGLPLAASVGAESEGEPRPHVRTGKSKHRSAANL